MIEIYRISTFEVISNNIRNYFDRKVPTKYETQLMISPQNI